MKCQAAAIPMCGADAGDSAHQTLKKVKAVFRALVQAARIERETAKTLRVVAERKRAEVVISELRGEELDCALAEDGARRAQLGAQLEMR